MTPTEPQKLGRYEVLEEIGKGAMGVVYLARDPLIGRLVALKTFRAGFAAKDDELAQFRSRFVREAQSAGILSHPNIVTIHDVVDEGANGVCFIAMEYVKGTNLKQLLQRTEPFSPAFVGELVAQIAEALDYAHSRGVIHRDIKPANILITADNKVKITDFGIARLDTSNLTMEGQLLGTPNYMAPEQIQARDVDHRADIFSLGVVFYEILTRKKPFQGENLTQVTHKIVYEPFTPPEEIVRGLAPAMSKILSRCLEKDPNRRYPRASEVARELRAVIEQAESLDDTAGTQEVTPVPSEPEMIPTRRLDRAEIAAAVAAEAGAAAPPAEVAPPVPSPG
ncbi:MAG: serine/threonine protein kinase, partial [Thermoanaerobaculia bacterium]